MSGFDWAGLLRAGTQGAGLKPHELWALTPYELTLILGVEGSAPPLTRARLMELDAQYGQNGGRDDGYL